MATLDNRIMDLLLAGHEVGSIAEILDVTAAQVLTCAQDLTQTPTAAGAQIAPAVSAPAVVSGTPEQDLTGEPSEVYVPVTGHAAGTVTVAVGPTNATADTIINADDASVNRTVRFRLPASWFYKVTAAGGATLGAATQITG